MSATQDMGGARDGVPFPPGEILSVDGERATADGLLTPIEGRPGQALAVFASASPIRHSDSFLVLDMAGADLSLLNTGRAPLLEDHCRSISSTIGVVLSAMVKGQLAYAHLRFANTPHAREIQRMAEDGILQNISMGFTFDADPLDGTTARIARMWRPFEISIVPVPANWNARILWGDESEEVIATMEAAKTAAYTYASARADETAMTDTLRRFASYAGPTIAASCGADPAGVVDAMARLGQAFAEARGADPVGPS